MKSYEIVDIKFSRSFNWNDGLFAIIKERKDYYDLCKIKSDGQPQMFDNGTLMITCVPKSIEGITKTSLLFAPTSLRIGNPSRQK